MLGTEFGKLLEKRPVHALGQGLTMNSTELPTEVDRKSYNTALLDFSASPSRFYLGKKDGIPLAINTDQIPPMVASQSLSKCGRPH